MQVKSLPVETIHDCSAAYPLNLHGEEAILYHIPFTYTNCDQPTFLLYIFKLYLTWTIFT